MSSNTKHITSINRLKCLYTAVGATGRDRLHHNTFQSTRSCNKNELTSLQMNYRNYNTTHSVRLQEGIAVHCANECRNINEPGSPTKTIHVFYFNNGQPLSSFGFHWYELSKAFVLHALAAVHLIYSLNIIRCSRIQGTTARQDSCGRTSQSLHKGLI